MANGHGGRREGAGKPKGVKWASTLANDRSRTRSVVVDQKFKISRAQIQHALGLKYLVTRERKTGKFTKVTAAMARTLRARGEEVIEVWEKDPSVQAFQQLGLSHRKADIRATRVLEELRRIVFMDPIGFVNEGPFHVA